MNSPRHDLHTAYLPPVETITLEFEWISLSQKLYRQWKNRISLLQSTELNSDFKKTTPIHVLTHVFSNTNWFFRKNLKVLFLLSALK